MYVTDDWIAGASLMGLSEKLLRKRIAASARKADGIAAVTPPIIDQLRSLGTSATAPAAVIPNGAPVVQLLPGLRLPIAGVVGQLNERLDLAVLEAVADAGVPLRLIGPRFDRDPEFKRRLDELISGDDVVWTGGLDQEQLSRELATISVGLTPYAESAFNRASCPLKTLEYLAAGVPVVSTDLAASRWLATEHVSVTRTTEEYVAAVRACIQASTTEDPALQQGRIEFAASHGWPERVRSLLALIEEAAERR